jgi:hypothetical protein
MRAAALIVLALATPAAAQPRCLPADDMREALARAGEEPAGVGLTAAGHMLEVWASPDGRTWTILVTGAGGVSCIAAHGHSYAPVRPPKGAPA